MNLYLGNGTMRPRSGWVIFGLERGRVMILDGTRILLEFFRHGIEIEDAEHLDDGLYYWKGPIIWTEAPDPLFTGEHPVLVSGYSKRLRLSRPMSPMKILRGLVVIGASIVLGVWAFSWISSFI